MIAPVKCGVISTYMASVTGLISDAWQVVVPRTERRSEFLRQSYACVGELKNKKSTEKEMPKKRYKTRTSEEVTHRSITLAQARLTALFWWDPMH